MYPIQRAGEAGFSRSTAYRICHSGKLPIPAEQLAPDTILVQPFVTSEAQNIDYARVSSADQKNDLDQQIARVMALAGKHTLPILSTITEIGSRLNDYRKRLQHLLGVTPHHIIVKHRDRLCLFGCDDLKAAFYQSGRSLVAADPGKRTEDLVRGLHDVIVGMSARLYGKGAATSTAARTLAEVTS
jgi:putative resolvase